MGENKENSRLVFDKKHDIDLTPEILAFELSMGFADQVILECSKRCISHADLANILGIKPATLSEKLNGSNLTLKSMASIALALDCDMKAPRLIPQGESSRSSHVESSEMWVHSKDDSLNSRFEIDPPKGVGRVMLSSGMHIDGKAFQEQSYSLTLKKEAA